MLRREGAAGRDPSQRTPIMDEPNFADRMKRMRETGAQLLQKTETAENAVSYRPPEFRRPVWYISMYAMVGGGGGTVNGLGMRSAYVTGTVGQELLARTAKQFRAPITTRTPAPRSQLAALDGKPRRVGAPRSRCLARDRSSRPDCRRPNPAARGRIAKLGLQVPAVHLRSGTAVRKVPACSGAAVRFVAIPLTEFGAAFGCADLVLRSEWTRRDLASPRRRQRSPTQPARSSAVRRVACPPAAWRAMS
jgi:hypothetical protein